MNTQDLRTANAEVAAPALSLAARIVAQANADTKATATVIGWALPRFIVLTDAGTVHTRTNDLTMANAARMFVDGTIVDRQEWR